MFYLSVQYIPIAVFTVWYDFFTSITSQRSIIYFLYYKHCTRIVPGQTAHLTLTTASILLLGYSFSCLCVLCSLSSAKENLPFIAILDTNFANMCEASCTCGKTKQNHRILRCCLKNSSSTRRACVFSVTRMIIANYNDVASKFWNMHRAPKAFGPTKTNTRFHNICQKNSQKRAD